MFCKKNANSKCKTKPPYKKCTWNMQIYCKKNAITIRFQHPSLYQRNSHNINPMISHSSWIYLITRTHASFRTSGGITRIAPTEIPLADESLVLWVSKSCRQMEPGEWRRNLGLLWFMMIFLGGYEMIYVYSETQR